MADIDTDALLKLAREASGSGMEVLEDHGHGVMSVRLKAEELRAFRKAAHPEAIIALLERVRELEQSLDDQRACEAVVCDMRNEAEAHAARLEGLLRTAREWVAAGRSVLARHLLYKIDAALGETSK